MGAVRIVGRKNNFRVNNIIKLGQTALGAEAKIKRINRFRLVELFGGQITLDYRLMAESQNRFQFFVATDLAGVNMAKGRFFVHKERLGSYYYGLKRT